MSARRIAAAVLAGVGLTMAVMSAPADAATVHLTKHQRANVVRIVQHLPTCHVDMVTNCKFREHHKTLASFKADHKTYFVAVKHGQVKHAEVFPR
jgi:hypothetical protein